MIFKNTESTILSDQVIIHNHINKLPDDNIKNEIISGLIGDYKNISCKYFYDKNGSELFKQITELPEYYPTRTELSILMNNAKNIVTDLRDTDIVELGSGDCKKIKILLENIRPLNRESIRYIPIDVSETAIYDASEDLLELFPEITIEGLVADFVTQLEVIPSNRPRLFLFLGSTIGNFEQFQAINFLKSVSSFMNHDDKLLLGMDMVKPPDILIPAYNDTDGITAKFNKNILNVINTIVDANFNTAHFDHKVEYNNKNNRIEMYLIANTTIQANLLSGNLTVNLKKGDAIHTENSHKYTNNDINKMAESSNLTINNIYTDQNNWFSLVELQKIRD